MPDPSLACRTCGFRNPRAWRACARCGGLLEAGVEEVRTATARAPSVRPPAADGSSGSTEPTAGSTEVVSPAQAPLVGQAAASAALRAGIERAFGVGEPCLVVLTGPAGSGRTRLLEHASELAAGIDPETRVLYGAARGEDEGGYAPFSRLLLDWFDVTPASSPALIRGAMATLVSDILETTEALPVAETTHLVGHVAGVPFPESPFLVPLVDAPDELHRRAVDAVTRLFEAEAARRPLVVLLDRMHEADELAWDLLRAVLALPSHLCVVLAGDGTLGARGRDAAGAREIAVVPIEPFGLGEVGTMLRLLVPALDGAPEPLVEALWHRSQGNPSALRELVLELSESGLFEETPQGLCVDLARFEEGGLPIGIDDAIDARLARLDAEERDVLGRAAVVGETFWDGAIVAQRRAERGPVDADGDPSSIWPDDADAVPVGLLLDRLEDRGFIVEVETSELPGAREYTFRLPRTRTRIYERLGEEVRTRRHLDTARWLMGVAAQRREGIACMIAPHLERAGLPSRAGRAYLEAAAFERAKGSTRAALRHIERALPLLPADDTLRRIDALHEHASLLTTVGRYDEALSALADMLRLAWTVGARGKGGAALNRMARVHQMRGEEERAATVLLRALELFRAAGDLRGVAATLDDLGRIRRLRGQYDLATEAAAEALAIRQAHGDRRGEALSLHNLASVALARGELAEAETTFREALRIREEIHDLEGLLHSHDALATLAFEHGAVRDAVASWTLALARAREMADRRSECVLLASLGEAHLALAELDAAAVALQEARRLADVLGDRRGAAEVERSLGLLALERGDEDAEARLAHALRLAESYGGRETLGRAHRAMGRLRARTLYDAGGGGSGAAEESYLTSIDLFRELGNEREVSRSLAELGGHLIEIGEEETARDRLREARAIMRRIGLGDLARVEQMLSLIGGNSPSERPQLA